MPSHYPIGGNERLSYGTTRGAPGRVPILPGSGSSVPVANSYGSGVASVAQRANGMGIKAGGIQRHAEATGERLTMPCAPVPMYPQTKHDMHTGATACAAARAKSYAQLPRSLAATSTSPFIPMPFFDQNVPWVVAQKWAYPIGPNGHYQA